MQRKLLFVLAFAGLFASANAQVSVTPEVGIGANMRTNLVDNKWKPTVKVFELTLISRQTTTNESRRRFMHVNTTYSPSLVRFWNEKFSHDHHADSDGKISISKIIGFIYNTPSVCQEFRTDACLHRFLMKILARKVY